MKGKSFSLQARGAQRVPGSRFPDYMTIAQDDGKVVSLRFYPQEIILVLISVRGCVDPEP